MSYRRGSTRGVSCGSVAALISKGELEGEMGEQCAQDGVLGGEPRGERERALPALEGGDHGGHLFGGTRQDHDARQRLQTLFEPPVKLRALLRLKKLYADSAAPRDEAAGVRCTRRRRSSSVPCFPKGKWIIRLAATGPASPT